VAVLRSSRNYRYLLHFTQVVFLLEQLWGALTLFQCSLQAMHSTALRYYLVTGRYLHVFTAQTSPGVSYNATKQDNMISMNYNRLLTHIAAIYHFNMPPEAFWTSQNFIYLS
jgi:hypothetical protein